MASSTAAPIIPDATISSTDRIARAHQTTFCARGLLKIIAVSEKGAGAHGNVPRASGCSTDGTPESAHTWHQRASAMGKRRSCDGRPHRAVQNQAFCCTGRPRRTVRCRKWPCGVREARLGIGGCTRRWQQRASAMGRRWSCDGRPHRAVQNQAICCTGRPRRTVRCRKWPCGVREARLSIGGCARRWQQEQD